MEIFSNFKAATLVIFFFGASIFVHELGHFLAARWRGLKVTRFSIGFGPKLFSWTRDGVEYIVAALPIGGYVALPQLGHMEMVEGEAEKVEGPEITWTSKVIVLVAGALFNVIFAIGIASILYFIGGRPVMEANESTIIGNVAQNFQDAEGNVVPNPAYLAGLQMGDLIKEIDGKPVSKWEDVDMKVIMGSGRTEDGLPLTTFSIERDGESKTIQFSPLIGGEEKVRQSLISPAMPALIGAVMENSPARISGMNPGDEIIEMDTTPVFTLHQISEYVRKNPEKEIAFKVVRDGQYLTRKVKPQSIQVNEKGDMSPMLGIVWSARMTTEKESPLAQIRHVVGLTFDTLEKLINPNSDIKLRHMSGPVGMGRLIYQSAQADIRYVLWVVVIININLAILNLLPIPVLDGGHILFASIEKIRGRKLPQNLLVSLQSAFVIVLLSLMVYVTVFDGLRIFRDSTQEQEGSGNEFRITFPTSDEASEITEAK
jgi:regulator of sigma E protease